MFFVVVGFWFFVGGWFVGCWLVVGCFGCLVVVRCGCLLPFTPLFSPFLLFPPGFVGLVVVWLVVLVVCFGVGCVGLDNTVDGIDHLSLSLSLSLVVRQGLMAMISGALL